MLLSTDKLDKAFEAAWLRDEDAIHDIPGIVMGGDGCNPITNMEDILEALDRTPGSPVCRIGPPDRQPYNPWYYLIGSESAVIAILNAIK